METKKFAQDIADINLDYTQWYTDVCLKTKLVDYGPVKGTMIMREYGYAIWELLQRQLDDKIKETGHKNVYFPLFIPLSYFTKEAEHVEGFAPELATVTQVGNEKLAEPFVVRPTSETIICEAFSRWVKSYKDLPVLINQWANVVRMEKTTRPFLRTTEFLWQEGHTLHRTSEEAEIEVHKMLNVYIKFCAEVLAIPMLAGKKSEKEKFAGAVYTMAIEAIMHDGKSLQCGTSHYLGTKFAKAFDIEFTDSDEQLKNPHQTSWGMTTRLIGAIIMVHGDNRGLRLPPKVAPIQVVIVPIANHKEGVNEKCAEIESALKKSGIRVETDLSDNAPGWKFNEWEVKGVPVRIECGPRDIENNQVTVFRRDTNEKSTFPLSNLSESVLKLLDDVQIELLKQAQIYTDTKIEKCNTYDDIVKTINSNKFAFAPLCEDRTCEDKLKADLGATIRCIPEAQTREVKYCAVCGKSCCASKYIARSY